MKFKEFRDSVLKAIEEKPEHYRNGQAAYNFIDEKYKVARDVQFGIGIDCFYDDEKIDKFIELSYECYKTTSRYDKSQ